MTTQVPASMEVEGVTAAQVAAKVGLTGDETIAGTKTFSSQPVLPQALTQGIAKASTSGSTVEFTTVPSWAKRVTLMLNGVSTTGSAVPQVQIGPTGGAETSGYLGSSELNGTGANMSSGFLLGSSWAGAVVCYGTVVLQQIDAAANTWVATINLGRSDSSGYMTGAGVKALAGALARIRITTTDAFDLGSINIIYE